MAHRVKKFRRETRPGIESRPAQRGRRGQNEKSPKRMVAVLLLAALAVVAVAGVALSAQKGGAPTPGGEGGDGRLAELPGFTPKNGIPHAVRGNPNATVALEAYEDYLCPVCKRFFDTAEASILSRYGDRIRLVWHEFPIEQTHPFAIKAAEAARCAGEQGRYWEMHDTLYSKQGEWGYKGDSPAYFKRYAGEMGLDSGEFNGCLDSGRHRRAVLEDQQEGVARGVGGTPTFFVNGRKIVGAQPLPVFAQAIEAALANG